MMLEVTAETALSQIKSDNINRIEKYPNFFLSKKSNYYKRSDNINQNYIKWLLLNLHN